MIRYDMLHNSALNLRGADELLKLSAAFENSVVPQEYGTGHTYILTYIHTYIHTYIRLLLLLITYTHYSGLE